MTNTCVPLIKRRTYECDPLIIRMKNGYTLIKHKAKSGKGSTLFVSLKNANLCVPNI